MAVYVDTLKKKNGHEHVLKVHCGPESRLVYADTLPLGAYNKKTSASLKPKKADKRARPCIFYTEDAGFCPSW